MPSTHGHDRITVIQKSKGDYLNGEKCSNNAYNKSVNQISKEKKREECYLPRSLFAVQETIQ
jgi:hypothetical protein